ncbi:Fc receptor-like protein 5 isoform X2 [Paralichthys olivaceus]|uniref:Fc receptor-like protein 5 isoform X2 n=1 Tax=Paralichthys olivaceus TaxID=8255 RepID=UPI003751B28D
MKNLQTLFLLPLLALASLFIKISMPGVYSQTISTTSYLSFGGSMNPHPVLTGPHMAYLGSRVAFWCIAHNSSPPVTYQLIRNSSIPIATGTDLQGDQPASFFLKVTATSEGLYHCNATAEGSTGVSNILTLSVVIPASNTRVTSEPSPPVAYEGSRIVLKCTVTRGSHLSYTWFFNRKEITSLTSPLFHLTGNELVMEQATPEHAGHYSCVASSMVQDIRRFSSSTEVKVTVKAYVSKPKISFSIISKGDGYQGNITCWSTRGSHPVNFSVSVNDEEVRSLTVNESLTVWFLVHVVLGQDMGVARCWVKTEAQELMSEPVTLEVVPVGGEVKAEVEYLYRADSKRAAAAKLRCMFSRGTFPHISWLLNDSVLPSETHEDLQSRANLPHVALANRSQTLVLTKLASEESGNYRCRVRDSFNDSGPWVESGDVLVQVTDRILNSMPRATSSTETPPKVFMTTTENIAIAFCCFLFLMLTAGVACVYRMFDHNQAQAHIAVTNPVQTVMS